MRVNHFIHALYWRFCSPYPTRTPFFSSRREIGSSSGFSLVEIRERHCTWWRIDSAKRPIGCIVMSPDRGMFGYEWHDWSKPNPIRPTCFDSAEAAFRNFVFHNLKGQ